MGDLDLPRQVSVHTRGKESSPCIDLANDLFESADLTTPFHPATFRVPAVSSRFDGSTVEKKAGEIYLLLRVFLI
jgi:hypothetical protein